MQIDWKSWLLGLNVRPASRHQRRHKLAAPIAIECCEARIVLSFTPHQEFVGQLYQDLLLRPASTDELAAFSGSLNSGAATRTQVALTILTSTEYRIEFIGELYQTYLQRDPSAAETAQILSSLASGTTVQQLTTTILTSPEFATLNGAVTDNSAFVSALYQGALGRPIDSATLATVVFALNAGLITRTSLITTVITSTEFLTGVVGEFYQEFLNRAPAAGEAAPFVSQLQSNVPIEQVAASLLGSSEYFSVAVAEFNVLPDVLLASSSVTFTEGGSRRAIDATAVVGDSDGGDFAGGHLSVKLTGNATSSDQLSVRHVGTGAGQIGFNATLQQVTFGSSVIGTYSGGIGAAALVVQFTAAANPANVQELLRNIVFRNVSVTPSTLARTATVQLSDGDGGSTTATKTINVRAVNTPPVLALTAGAIEYRRGIRTATVDPGVVISDIDNATFAGGQLIVRTATGANANDRLQVPNQGTGVGQVGILYEGTTRFVLFSGIKIGTLTGGSGSVPLVLQISSGATPAAIQAVARSITFRNLVTSPLGARVIEFKVSDGVGGTSIPLTRTINVLA